MTFVPLAEKAIEKIYFIGGVALLVLAPYLLSRIVMQLAMAYFPTWVQLVFVTVFFVLLIFWAWLISGDRGVRLIHRLYKQGIKWPFLFSVAMLVFALLPFAALTSILAELGHVTLEPPVPRGEFWRLQDLYLWHFLDSVPGLEIPETLLWPEPFRYKDPLSGALLLAFKIVVIIPVIASFTVWAQLRKDHHAKPSQRT